MKLIVCVKQDLPGNIALNWLLPHLRGTSTQVLLSNVTRDKESNLSELADLKFYERDIPMEIVFPILDNLSSTPKKPFYTFNEIEAKFGIPYRLIYDINAPQELAKIRAFAPDLILSIRFSLIFKQAIIDIPKHGIFNLHPGELPRYAGLFSPFWTLLNGSTRIGCTLHRVDTKIDHGPIVGIRYLDINPDKSLIWHINNLYPLGIEMFSKLLADLKQDRLPVMHEQDLTQREYRSLPAEEDFRRFRERGLILVSHKEFIDSLAGYVPTLPVPLAMANSATFYHLQTECSS